MKNALVKILACWIALTTGFTVSGCGKLAPAEPLRVSVKIPPEEYPEVFWLGVERKLLEVSGKGGQSSHEWREGSAWELDLEEGDRLVFRGTGAEGELLVTGEAEVGEAKFLSIPLRRVL